MPGGKKWCCGMRQNPFGRTFVSPFSPVRAKFGRVLFPRTDFLYPFAERLH